MIIKSISIVMHVEGASFMKYDDDIKTTVYTKDVGFWNENLVNPILEMYVEHNSSRTKSLKEVKTDILGIVSEILFSERPIKEQLMDIIVSVQNYINGMQVEGVEFPKTLKAGLIGIHDSIGYKIEECESKGK